MRSFDIELDGTNAPSESEDRPYRRVKPLQVIPSDVVCCQKHRPAHEKCACWWNGCTTVVNCYSRVADERVRKLLDAAFPKMGNTEKDQKRPLLCSVHQVTAITAVFEAKSANPDRALVRWLQSNMCRPVVGGHLRRVS